MNTMLGDNSSRSSGNEAAESAEGAAGSGLEDNFTTRKDRLRQEYYIPCILNLDWKDYGAQGKC